MLIRLAVSYFLSVFAVGFALGVVRVLWLVEAIGERYAELLETPIMLMVSYLVARFIVSRFADSLTLIRSLLFGVVSLVLLLSVEFSAVLWMRGLTLDEYFAQRDPVSGIAYLIALIWFAFAPAVCFYRGAHGQYR